MLWVVTIFPQGKIQQEIVWLKKCKTCARKSIWSEKLLQDEIPPRNSRKAGFSTPRRAFKTLAAWATRFCISQGCCCMTWSRMHAIFKAFQAFAEGRISKQTSPCLVVLSGLGGNGIYTVESFTIFPKNNRSIMMYYTRYIPIRGHSEGMDKTLFIKGCTNLC